MKGSDALIVAALILLFLVIIVAKTPTTSMEEIEEEFEEVITATIQSPLDLNEETEEFMESINTTNIDYHDGSTVELHNEEKPPGFGEYFKGPLLILFVFGALIILVITLLYARYARDLRRLQDSTFGRFYRSIRNMCHDPFILRAAYSKKHNNENNGEEEEEDNKSLETVVIDLDS